MQVNLRRWLCRPQRVVQPKESFWIFCEVLLLLEQSHAESDPPRQRLRPSRMFLHNTGKVTFMPLAAVAGGTQASVAVAPESRNEQAVPAAAAYCGPRLPLAGESLSTLSNQPAAAAAGPSSAVLPLAPLPAAAAAAATTTPQLLAEEEVFRSPEEEAGGVAGTQSDMFALGILFVDLFFVAPHGRRNKVSALAAVRL